MTSLYVFLSSVLTLCIFTSFLAVCVICFPLSASWYEIARPQIHGYNMHCIAPIPGNVDHQYASGGEEKIVRVFLAPKPFLSTLSNIAGYDTKDPEDAGRALRANLAELGLTNKPQMQADAAVPTAAGLNFMASYVENPSTAAAAAAAAAASSTPEVVTETKVEVVAADESATPKTEENTIRETLWAEMDKLYGHGYELYALDASHNGKFLASTCVAKQAQHAAIRIWDTSNWTEAATLPCHNTTVVQLEFSHGM
jgi:elongator complex protein 2